MTYLSLDFGLCVGDFSHSYAARPWNGVAATMPDTGTLRIVELDKLSFPESAPWPRRVSCCEPRPAPVQRCPLFGGLRGQSDAERTRAPVVPDLDKDRARVQQGHVLVPTSQLHLGSDALPRGPESRSIRVQFWHVSYPPSELTPHLIRLRAADVSMHDRTQTGDAMAGCLSSVTIPAPQKDSLQAVGD